MRTRDTNPDRRDQHAGTLRATCYLLGVSTRRMDKLFETLGITQLSKSQVSVTARELDGQSPTSAAGLTVNGLVRVGFRDITQDECYLNTAEVFRRRIRQSMDTTLPDTQFVQSCGRVWVRR